MDLWSPALSAKKQRRGKDGHPSSVLVESQRPTIWVVRRAEMSGLNGGFFDVDAAG